MGDITIRANSIEKLLASLNPTKAAGPDGITPCVLRELAKELSPILTTIYQSSMRTGQVPQDWKEALVTPMFKKGEHYTASNYRPISLTSVPAKILEHVLVSAIMRHLDSNSILSAQQDGFCKYMYHSCETQLLEIVEEVSSAMEKGVATDVWHRVVQSVGRFAHNREVAGSKPPICPDVVPLGKALNTTFLTSLR
ncbi:Hypp5351 [Branchiostoma lanceolatum]|uniref:Hypp5351 protein n=1 Tax=Branchiostoma lanceolatum TaxID=7740 RepID=A0A8K0AGI7_BRALA|nr:Hypp5351 [Branchiostoma lanceolatum]